MLKHLKFVLFLTCGFAVTVSETRGDPDANTPENNTPPAIISDDNQRPALSRKMPLPIHGVTSFSESLVQVADRLRKQRERRDAMNKSGGGGKDMEEVEICCALMNSAMCTVMTANSHRCYGHQKSDWYPKSSLPPNYIPSPKYGPLHSLSHTNDVTNSRIPSPVRVKPILENSKLGDLVFSTMSRRSQVNPPVTDANGKHGGLVSGIMGEDNQKDPPKVIEAKLGELLSSNMGEHHKHDTPPVTDAIGKHGGLVSGIMGEHNQKDPPKVIEAKLGELLSSNMGEHHNHDTPPVTETNGKHGRLVSGILSEHNYGPPPVIEANEAKLGELVSSIMDDHGTPQVIEANGIHGEPVSSNMDGYNQVTPPVTDANEAKLRELLSVNMDEHHNHGTPRVIEAANGTDQSHPIKNGV